MNPSTTVRARPEQRVAQLATLGLCLGLLGCTTAEQARPVADDDPPLSAAAPGQGLPTSQEGSDDLGPSLAKLTAPAHRRATTCDELQRQADDQQLLSGLLDDYLPQELGVLLEDPEGHRLQIIVGHVVEPADGPRCLVEHGLRVDAEYFYPASTVKTAASVAALQLVGQREGPLADLEVDDVLWLHELDDPEAPTEGLPPTRAGSLRHLVEQAQIISSNRAYNHLFDLVGHQGLNQAMWQAGFKSTRLQHRFFSDRTPEQERWSPAVSRQQVDSPGQLRHLLPPRQSSLVLAPVGVDGLEVGRSFIDDGEIHHRPMDFTPFNYLSLRDHLHLMVALFQPDLTPRQFEELSEEHRALLTEVMLRDPLDVAPELGPGAQRRFKPARAGVEQAVPRQALRYYNKGGRAYGFHIENAYIVDTQQNQALFLAAVVYVNANQRLNDNTYEYDELSFPFFHALGAIIAGHFF